MCRIPAESSTLKQVRHSHFVAISPLKPNIVRLVGSTLIETGFRRIVVGMEVQIECLCGTEISELTEGEELPSFNLKCAECRAIYAVTVTQLRGGKISGE